VFLPESECPPRTSCSPGSSLTQRCCVRGRESSSWSSTMAPTPPRRRWVGWAAASLLVTIPELGEVTTGSGSHNNVPTVCSRHKGHTVLRIDQDNSLWGRNRDETRHSPDFTKTSAVNVTRLCGTDPAEEHSKHKC